MILNGITGNLFRIEESLSGICKATNKKCTVFAVYDMCRDKIANYPNLKNAYKKPEIEEKKKFRGGEGEDFKSGNPYWHIAGTESYGLVSANSILAKELLVRF